jgi:predicted CoA-binding protein
VWLQSGITDPAFEQALAEAGIKVVSNACLKVEHQQAAMASRM